MTPVLEIPSEQLKRIPLETIVFLLAIGRKKEDLVGLNIGLPVNGLHVRISIETVDAGRDRILDSSSRRR